MYTLELEVMSHDSFPSGIARPSSVLRYLQEAANHQMFDMKPSYDDVLDSGKAFVISRIGIRMTEPLMKYDKIKVETWPVAGRGATFDRCYRILRDGKPVLEAHGVWALVNVGDGRLCRQSEIDLSAYEHGPLLEVPDVRFREPQEGFTQLGTHRVAYSEIDRNIHMNNTNYPDMLVNFAPETATHYPSSFAIHFVSEAPLGAELSISCSVSQETDGGVIRYFRSELAGRVNVVAKFNFTTNP